MTPPLIGARIKALREERQLSQDDLARLFGFKDRQTVSAIETGERRVSAEELIVAVEKLRAPLDYFTDPFLLVGEGQPYSARDVTDAVNLPVLASLPDDPESAAVFSCGAQPPKRFETGPLARALQAAIASIHSTITLRRNELLAGARS